MEISAKTRVCAVIGDPVEHSLSPDIQNAAFQQAGLDFTYVAFHVLRGRLLHALNGVRALGIRGLSVTIPHKVDIIPFLDEVAPEAAHVGSVNTVVNDNGRLIGHSTDGHGAIRAFESQGVQVAGKSVMVLGSGGAARAIAFALAVAKPKPTIRILGVIPKELETLAGDLTSRTGTPVSSDLLTAESLADAIPQSEIIVHATPVGMAPKTGECLVPSELLRPDLVVFDAVYTPLKTRLLENAEKAGARIVPGLGMFVHQGAIQFELWTGERAPVEIMEQTVTAALARRNS
jgi:shikimate dehydrogenase